MKLLHSGDIQSNPGPVSSEMQGHASRVASVLASVMPRGLKIGEWNVQSLYNKIDQMRQVLDARSNNIHILCITETRLTNSHTKFETAIQGYSLKRHDMAEGNGGGVAAYIHESVSYKRHRYLETYALEALSLVVQMSFPDAKHLPITTVDRLPNATVAWYNDFDVFMGQHTAQECELVLMGDINVQTF